MSKGTLERLAVRYFQTATADLKVEQTDTGTRIIRSIAVFRSGTFKDSWGDPHTWEAEHLEQMVFNFNLLRNRNVLPNVPVRDGHPGLFGSGGEVVGYVVDLYTVNGAAYEDGQTRLLADLEITEPDAYGKIERGTWRGRSAEIGFYETNDEVMYWPVFMGLAWVDVPAVEGLFSKNKGDDSSKFTFIRDNDQEGAVAGAKKQTKNHSQSAPDGGGSPAGAENPAGDGSGQQGEGTESTGENPNDEGGSEGGSEGGDGAEGADGGSEGGDGGDGGEGTPPAPTQHSHPSAGVHTFRIAGQETTDFGRVQAHIDALEGAAEDRREQDRRDFVSSLAERGLIAATQIDATTDHALSLSGDQWQAFTKMYPEDAAPAALFQHHGSNDSESDPSGNNGPSEVDTLREIVANHKRSGMPEAKIHETKSYRRLMELTDGKG